MLMSSVIRQFMFQVLVEATNHLDLIIVGYVTDVYQEWIIIVLG
jgi:hypothetical protein